MPGARLPPDESERLAILQALKLLDTAPEPAFDRIVRLAQALSGADTALVSLVDRDRQWFKAKVGLDACETSRDVAFCAHAIHSRDVLWVEDAPTDPRFADNPLVTGAPFIRFYAGAPLIIDNRAIGTLCVFDSRPQGFDVTFAAQLADLADLAASEIQNRRSRYLYKVSRNISDATADAILCGDRQGRIIYWNRAAEQMFGYSAEEALGQSLSIIMPERMRAAHEKGYAHVVNGGHSKMAGKPVEVPGLRRGGEEFPIELSLAVWGEGSGRGVAAIIRDCTDRHAQRAAVEEAHAAALAASRESEAARETMTQMVRHAPVALVMTNRELRILEVSGRWSDDYGRPAPAVVGKTMHELFPEGRAQWDPIYQRGLSGQHDRGERSGRAPDGDARWFQWEVAPWRDGAGSVAGLLLMNVDVTDLVRAREAAEAADRMKSEFLANMSHEVRTPLNGVLGMAGALTATRLDPAQGEMVELIQTSAGDLERLLTDMLDLARYQGGVAERILEPLDLGAVAREAASAAGAAARAKGLLLELDVQGGGAARVLGDGPRLRQVLDALLDNAIKFTDRGSIRLQLNIEPSAKGARAVFQVRDTGVGFSPADKERLFRPFEQADGSSTRRFGGSGIGLALCRSIAGAIGGTLDAQPNPRGGSTFTFAVDLPVEGPGAVASAA